ncbi:MAG: hypothetical protein QF682_01005 [Candidatus Thermoplasmatota archaeon]|nr:hypothetical protein [Candidatus Thermoplasmatota archaeon]
MKLKFQRMLGSYFAIILIFTMIAGCSDKATDYGENEKNISNDDLVVIVGIDGYYGPDYSYIFVLKNRDVYRVTTNGAMQDDSELRGLQGHIAKNLFFIGNMSSDNSTKITPIDIEKLTISEEKYSTLLEKTKIIGINETHISLGMDAGYLHVKIYQDGHEQESEDDLDVIERNEIFNYSAYVWDLLPKEEITEESFTKDLVDFIENNGTLCFGVLIIFGLLIVTVVCIMVVREIKRSKNGEKIEKNLTTLDAKNIIIRGICGISTILYRKKFKSKITSMIEEFGAGILDDTKFTFKGPKIELEIPIKSIVEMRIGRHNKLANPFIKSLYLKYNDVTQKEIFIYPNLKIPIPIWKYNRSVSEWYIVFENLREKHD